MILDILKYTVDGGFWHFIGCWIIIGLPFELLYKLSGLLLTRAWPPKDD